jgi:hypothetical protein
MDNEQIIRNAYHLAEIKDVSGWVAGFTEDGTFTDESTGVVYRGPKEVGRPVEVYAKAFHDMHRELVRFEGDKVPTFSFSRTAMVRPARSKQAAPHGSTPILWAKKLKSNEQIKKVSVLSETSDIGRRVTEMSTARERT